MAATDTKSSRSGRERILDAAYDLFSRGGVRAIGVDTITAEADVAKMTLYRNFASKNELAIAFMALREERWTVGWVQDEVMRRASTPAARMLVDLRDLRASGSRAKTSRAARSSRRCSSSRTATDPVRQACVTHLAKIRAFVCELATEAGVEDPERFAAQWHILMKGSIVAAHEGDSAAAMKARELGELLLERDGVALTA